MITTSNISMQFGSKPLFESISVAFSDKNRYGLIGANGSGKSTFMKILTGELEPTAGTISIDKNKRVSKLNQDQFAYENIKVSDCENIPFKNENQYKKSQRILNEKGPPKLILKKKNNFNNDL